VDAALATYNAELTAVKLKAALQTAMNISALGNKLLQDNKLDNALFASNAPKCARVVVTALAHIHLLASLIEPYLPLTTASILSQLEASKLVIPDVWDPNSIKPGHKIGKPAYLFSQIKPEKEVEWREHFGGEEQKKAKREAAEKKAKKAAEKKAKKDKKAAAAGAEGKAAKPSVEQVEKGGKISEGTAVEEVVEGVKQVVIPSS
jgi:methionyl-tRNA synthetase